MPFLFKNSLVNVIYLLIRCYKTRFVLWNTNNTDRNGVNKQNTHTHTKHSEKDNTGTITLKQPQLFYQSLHIYGKKNPLPCPTYNWGGGIQLWFSFFKLRKWYSLIENLPYKKQIILAAKDSMLLIFS